MNLIPIFRFVFSKKRIASQDVSPRWVIIWLVIMMLVGASVICMQCEFRIVEAQEEELTHTIFLPIILSSPQALKGAALTGPCSAIGQLEARWYYNWGWGSGCDIPARQFVPMIRDVTRMDHLSEAVENARASGWLMGFNEPDMPEPYGHLTTPVEGAEAWRTIEEAATGIKLLSPTPSQENPGWLWQMVAEYETLYGEKPCLDAIGVHWYNWEKPSSAQPAKDHLLQVRQEALAHGYDVPIWLTEFAGRVREPDPAGGHQKLMEELIPWMQAQPWIARYAWFATYLTGDQAWCLGCRSCSLTDPETGQQLTPPGEFYRDI